MQAAAAPASEIPNLISHRAELELVLARRAGAINAEEHWSGSVAVNANTIIIRAVPLPHAQADEFVICPNISVGNGIGRRLDVADELKIKVGKCVRLETRCDQPKC